MKAKLRFGVLGLVLALALFAAGSVQAGRPQDLTLYWREVVPAGTGDPNLVGDAYLDISPGQGQLCYTFRVGIFASLEVPTGATINQAPAGSNGPVVIDLNPDFGPLGKQETSGCVRISSSLAHSLQRSPSQYYIQVYDADYPKGAARAQLTK